MGTSWASRRLPAERGATMLEYALMVTLIAVVVTSAVVALGPAVSDLFTNAATSL